MGLAFAICLLGRPAAAQGAALAVLASRSEIEYAVNESGGRVTVRAPSADPRTVEALQLELLEAAAAIRRGDLRASALFRVDSPALADLARSRDRIRCTFRPNPRGGELVLLSDHDPTVAAIQRLLSERPPKRSRRQGA